MPASVIDIKGKVYGRWTVLSFCGVRDEIARWLCRCSCGVEREVAGTNLRIGRTLSCGCLRNEITQALLNKRNTIHGKHDTVLYQVWQSMKTRVLNPQNKDYHRYGGRGIAIYGPWLNDFQRFYSDVVAEIGDRSSAEYSIDRINGDGNYEPGNLRWATTEQQTRNTCRTRLIAFNGETLCITDWATRFGVRRNLIYQRLNLGWTVDRALTEPSVRATTRPFLKGVTRE